MSDTVNCLEITCDNVTVKNVTINGIDCVACENEAKNCDILIVPITDTSVLVYNFMPLNGDDGWDATKVAIISSIQVAQ